MTNKIVAPPLQAVKSRRAMTLVELLIALTIMAIMFTAVAALIYGTMNTDRFMRTQSQAISEVELATRRIMYNLRSCSIITTPTDTNATNTITILTQPDPTNGNLAYTVTYALAGNNITETDTRYGTNTLVHNASTFSVARLSLISPESILVTITLPTTPAITRTFTVQCRNDP
jgi:prepilin-type N-terminal cleavage/methylation domain-containing protein